MKKYLYIAMMVVALLPLASCSENEPMDYAGQPALYFDLSLIHI